MNLIMIIFFISMQNRGNKENPDIIINEPKSMIELQMKRQKESTNNNNQSKQSNKTVNDLKSSELDRNSQLESLKYISWNKHDEQSMIFAQKKLNQIMINNNFLIDRDTQNYIQMLTKDMENIGVSTCDVCGNKQSRHTHMNIEHITMETSWGYESDYDCQTHKLTLCCKCYSTHILRTPLGKFVQVTNYM
jgi:hypothetical protein